MRALEDVLGTGAQEDHLDMRLEPMFALQGKPALERLFTGVVPVFLQLDFASQLVVDDEELGHANLLTGL